MTIAITCTCGRRYKTDEQYAGKKTKCPHCHASILVLFGGAAEADVSIKSPRSSGSPTRSDDAAGGEALIRPPRSRKRSEKPEGPARAAVPARPSKGQEGYELPQSPVPPPPLPATRVSAARPLEIGKDLDEPASPSPTRLTATSPPPPVRPAAKKKAPRREAPSKSGGFFGIEKRGVAAGVLGGLLMMVIAVVWFLLGLAADIIFFYPPILFIIGLFAFLKGIVTGNVAGEKERGR